MINKIAPNSKECIDSILNTLLYSDIFAFPLNKFELWYFLKSHIKIPKTQFFNSLKSLPDNVAESKGYFCLKDRTGIINKRIKREIISQSKYQIAKKTATLLSFIPTIYFIGISGSLAYHNSDKNDDIDFFIITKKNALWITRLICILILEIFGLRRRRLTTNAVNKVCLNMFIDENQLNFFQQRRDIYTAHEIAQLKPLIDKNDMYKNFILANAWIKIFMPNVINIAISNSDKLNLSKKSTILNQKIFMIPNETLAFVLANPILEYLARSVQYLKISKNQTTEIVNYSLAAFHPHDYRKRVLRLYKERLKGKNLSAKLVFTNRLWYYFNMHKAIKSLILILALLLLFSPKISYAQITPSPAVLPTCMPSQLNPSGCIPTNVEGFVAEYYKYGLGIIGGFAVLMIIFGSYQILVSRGNPKILNDGKTIIIYAISGLLLAIFGFVFIEVIAKDILHIPGFG